MVRIQWSENDSDQDAAVFTVYETKKGAISGRMDASVQTGERSATFCTEPYGLPVDEAFQRAVSFCERHHVPTLFVKDPKSLWPDGRKIG